jgi:NADPH:quinone reductase-like Zn-dependent oxidoreductase
MSVGTGSAHATRMHAVRVEEYGPPEVLRWVEVDAPRPGPGEIAIAIRGATVSGFDLLYREGRMANGRPGRPAGFGGVPFQLGREGAGEVAEVGEGVDRFSVGDRVVVMTAPACGHCAYCRRGADECCIAANVPGFTSFGTQAERIVIRATDALSAPEGLSWEASAAAIHNYVTVWHAMFGRGRLVAGQTVLITGAGGGLGAAALTLARFAGAQTVIAVTGAPAKTQRLLELGADVVLNWREQNVPAEVRKITGIGVDLALDNVGGPMFTLSFASVRLGGTVVAAAEMGGTVVDSFDLGHLLGRQANVLGSRSSSRLEQETVLALVGKGVLKPIIADVMPMSDAAEAHRRLESGQLTGKIVLVT